MKRATFLILLVVLAAALLPAIAYAQAATPQPTATAVTAAPATAAPVTYPEAEPPVSAQEAYDSTVWMKPGDGLNLLVAVLCTGAIFGIIAWGIVAQRRVART